MLFHGSMSWSDIFFLSDMQTSLYNLIDDTGEDRGNQRVVELFIFGYGVMY
jgi:hypothetical protein